MDHLRLRPYRKDLSSPVAYSNATDPQHQTGSPRTIGSCAEPFRYLLRPIDKYIPHPVSDTAKIVFLFFSSKSGERVTGLFTGKPERRRKRKDQVWSAPVDYFCPQGFLTCLPFILSVTSGRASSLCLYVQDQGYALPYADRWVGKPSCLRPHTRQTT